MEAVVRGVERSRSGVDAMALPDDLENGGPSEERRGVVPYGGCYCGNAWEDIPYAAVVVSVGLPGVQNSATAGAAQQYT
jgi:hypothetical protein